MLFPLQKTVSRNQRTASMRQCPAVVWFTGLSGSGKSTIAVALEKKLLEEGLRAYLLDGDTIRTGLNKDLTFSDDDRRENIRRIGEVCKILNDSGLIVIVALISPFKADRQMVKSLLPVGEFIEVYVNASLEACEERDVKGLYKKARAGTIERFTGISAPYEIPENPDILLNTETESVEDSLQKVLEFLLPKVQLSR